MCGSLLVLSMTLRSVGGLVLIVCDEDDECPRRKRRVRASNRRAEAERRKDGDTASELRGREPEVPVHP